ncbi:MAG: arylsulfatase [Acidobacteria bacterium]|nr:arylsulfatase [Acidobacteriota bacterium]
MVRLRLLALMLLASALHAADRPNIVVILMDDLGYSDLGCYGGEISTPNIDALAKDGVRFESFYNSARCCPSRASLMTGLYPPQAGIASFTTRKPDPKRGPAYLGRLNDRCVTLGETLGNSGYSCYYVGKWHLHNETGPTERGFDEFFGYTFDHSHDQWDAAYYERLPKGRKKEIDRPQGEFYATDVFNEYALEFIKQGQKQKDKPWFLFLGHSSPHFPVQAPAEDADKYFETYMRGWDVLREERFARMKKIGLIDGKRWSFTERSLVPVDRDDIANGYSGKQNPAWDTLDKPRQMDLARRMSLFAAMVEHVDRGIGEIVAHLKKTGQYENTAIMLLSDNGACYEWGPFGFDGQSRKGITTLHEGEDLREMGGPGTHHSYGSAWANLGNTPFRLYKHFTQEGGVATPFIFHWPAGLAKTGGWVRERGHIIDVMPTLRALAGAPYPSDFAGRDVQPEEGVSLIPAIQGKKLAKRPIYFEHQAARGVIEGDWKVVWGKRMPYEITWELYNLRKDRSETHDVADSHPGIVDRLSAMWRAYAERTGLDIEGGN